RRPDAAPGCADLRRPGRLFAGQVECTVIRKNDVGRVADLEVVADPHAELAKVVDFFQQRFRIDHHAVAQEAELPRVDDSGGEEAQRVMLVGELDRVPGVVTALKAGHDIEVVAQQVDDLSFSFVAPLRSDDRQIPRLFGHERTAETSTRVEAAEGPASTLRSSFYFIVGAAGAGYDKSGRSVPSRRSNFLVMARARCCSGRTSAPRVVFTRSSAAS